MINENAYVIFQIAYAHVQVINIQTYLHICTCTYVHKRMIVRKAHTYIHILVRTYTNT